MFKYSFILRELVLLSLYYYIPLQYTNQLSRLKYTKHFAKAKRFTTFNHKGNTTKLETVIKL